MIATIFQLEPIGKKILNTMKTFPDLLAKPEMRKAMTQILTLMAGQAKKQLHPGFGVSPHGGLMRSMITGQVISQSKNELSGVVGDNVKYAPYQEFGTGRLGSGSYAKAKSNYGIDLSPDNISWGSHKGMIARAFLTTGIGTIYRDTNKLDLIISRAIDKIWGKGI